MKKYRTDRNTEITDYEVIEETDQAITFKRTRLNGKPRVDIEYKDVYWCSWHDTFEEAKQFLISLHNSRIETLKRSIQEEELKIKAIQNLTEE